MNALWRKTPAPEELIEQAALRRQIYRVQATCFLDPPDEELLAFLGENYPHLLDGEENTVTEEGLKALRVDFTNLFLLSSPPYEAALMDESGHLNSKATDRVTDFYRATGFNPGLGSGGSRHSGLLAMDHISAELEFLSHLAGREEVAWQEGNRELAVQSLNHTAQFMDAHYLRWMPLLMVSSEEDAETGFYRALAKWTREFTLADRKHIDGILKAI
ncbi:MAG: molecular chaperone TorD family protein [Nitrospinaceae bacterium]|jgi:TorA maturation chaperone TorD|nr:molecular chaperone TorD family protein [Nitrospinaceae bacterium]MBT3432781.1 molecular chaperone TorD family protein [Nitrospinaceae bacterium]MBT3820414.1 molecular chaperone TorD family protein [Nitrospinaceae bacterium]MBT4093011.1 molecular chaperone TorD family protein [Nitrospinaceae bacterium]MBT4431125.1 molecular chaperone TorD family protein [Nitrospinaceae bacterium]